MGSIWEPMLITTVKKEADRKHLTWPMIGQPKLDGYRSVNRGTGFQLSRQLKPIPNRHVQGMFGGPENFGLDGELIYGHYFDNDAYRNTNSALRLDGPEDIDYYIWDDFTYPNDPYYLRYERAGNRVADLQAKGRRAILLESVPFASYEGAIEISADWESQGAEGGVGKRRDGKYKEGRSTVREHYGLKFKSWEDQEGVITGFEELYSNQNEATLNERGKTTRTSHQENQVPMGTLGAIKFELAAEWPEREGKCGSGYTQKMRDWIWAHRQELIGAPFTFKFQRRGSFEKPRFPIFKRFPLIIQGAMHEQRSFPPLPPMRGAVSGIIGVGD